MTQIFAGRYTAKTDQPFVLFLIGMRINKVWQVGKWWSVAKEMPPMTRNRTPQTMVKSIEFDSINTRSM